MGNILYPEPQSGREKKVSDNDNANSFIYAILEYDLKRMDDMSMMQENESTCFHANTPKKKYPIHNCKACNSMRDKDLSISSNNSYTDETMSAGGNDDIFKDIRKAMDGLGDDNDNDRDTMSVGSDYSSYGDESL